MKTRVCRKGVYHAYPTEKLIAFRDVPAHYKLEWLEEMRQLLSVALSPERRAIMERFRRGEI